MTTLDFFMLVALAGGVLCGLPLLMVGAGLVLIRLLRRDENYYNR